MKRLSENIKFHRKRLSMTQEQFAEAIDVKRAAIGSYEEGRATPPLDVLLRMAKLFGLTLDELVQSPASKRPKGIEQYEENFKVLAITVDKEDNEWIDLIPEKASAGYTSGYADPEYLGEMPKFRIPTLRSGTFRAFEIKGDSMLPLQSGTVIIGEYVSSLQDIQSGATYIVVTKNEGIVYKRVINRLATEGRIVLQSDNMIYPPYEVSPAEIVEVWQAKAFISTFFPDPDISMHQIMDIIQDLRTEVSDLRSNKRLE